MFESQHGFREFCKFIADWAVVKGYGFSHVITYEDKSLFKAQGPVWHKRGRAKNYIPKGLRNKIYELP